jgi:hypothetical protein
MNCKPQASRRRIIPATVTTASQFHEEVAIKKIL